MNDELELRIAELERKVVDAESNANKALIYVAILFLGFGLLGYRVWGGLF
jgi:hypothetical protein